MTTINISIPEKLKTDAEKLIKQGFYASFSDLVRDSIRHVLNVNKYDRWAAEAKEDLKNGKAVVLKNANDIEKYMESIR
ncbi:MAG: hypothetical protein UU16_C0057G0016 [Candidatus Woesebacteria bacterium GW2011_GWA2_40_7]|uniref:Ribbon-helix-helix protein CopG domain-containing protein n=3 Tax=Candidatus Woeseibacteriota TaxID=1752722 RepID=A0A0G0UUE2_9BACT|nr:MAG: hypothetical protein UT17_C0001G0132 [Candidatus Woesebacteria bacterium GW2011_GWB1_39_10]KKR71650.1 MAG: hypothetical protein UU16_C0057G0016 [Candidatus Woesebacteria bacterium GW2011_GWA2_40_7]KKR92318.1 MAG: hypothetical protein UU42_C0002G0132 [Candidatus Woesebacteria bacterium GW2011_GWA1_41_13b]